VLGADPRGVAIADISEVAILETIARGRTVYQQGE
jgi:hypothetical protein